MSNDLFNTLKEQYSKPPVPAQALFFHYDGHNTHALRIEAPTIAKEFTDNSWIGTDPNGFLYYYNVRDFDPKFEVKYNSAQVQNPSDGQTCARVDFYHKEDDNSWDTDPFATFLAYDPESIVTASEMNGWSSVLGKWDDLKIAQSTGLVEKFSTSHKVTFTVDVIGKKATFEDTNGVFPRGTDVVSRGMFSFKKIKDIASGTYAGYNKDRVVFYNGPNATDFVGYFIPSEGDAQINTLGDINAQFTPVTWTDI